MSDDIDAPKLFSPSMLEAQRRYADPIRASRIINAMPDIRRIDDSQREYLEALPFFFIATAGSDGRLQCNFKGGGPGIIHVASETTLYYPEFPGNDLMLSVGNMLENSRIGILALSFFEQRRLKINGRTAIEEVAGHPLEKRWPDARILVKVEVDQVIRNCSRRIPKLMPVSEQANDHIKGE
jgi:predicted pyridoxine 5'-phosphate oxidase superfamily flavin-nucleotide-binding protein